MKKILIIKPKVIEDGTIIHYIYPKNYNAQHAKHICYNFSNGKNLKGGHLAEGVVIYEANKNEIELLLQQDGVEEISYNKANIVGKRWKPKRTVDTPKGKVEMKAFDIKDWVKSG